MNQALDFIRKARLEWLVHELGSRAEQRQARETARRMFREAGGMAGVTPAGVARLSLWCEDGSAFVMEGRRSGDAEQMQFTEGRIWDDIALTVSGEWGPYDVNDPYLAAWLLGLVT